MLLTITNLYPRPDEPQRGLFNAQFFDALHKKMKHGRYQQAPLSIRNVCLVPSWHIEKWPMIRAWADPHTAPYPTRYLPVFYMPIIGRSLNWITYLMALRKIENDAKQAKAILATWLYPDAVAGARLARTFNKPLWIKIHGSDIYHLNNASRRKLILAACTQAKGIFCVASWMRDFLEEAGVDSSKIYITPNGVNTAAFYPQNREKARWHVAEALNNPPESTKIVLFLGRLAKVKGPDIMLKAWSLLGDTRKQAKLVMLGSGEWQRKIERMARSLRVNDSVVFVRAQPHNEIPVWLNAADCICMPSRSEGMPNVVLESLACGVPVVGADVGEMPTLIRNGETGEIVPAQAGNLPEQLASALRNTLQKKWNRDAIAASIIPYTWGKAADIALDKIFANI